MVIIVTLFFIIILLSACGMILIFIFVHFNLFFIVNETIKKHCFFFIEISSLVVYSQKRSEERKHVCIMSVNIQEGAYEK